MSQENHSFEILTIPCLSDNYAYILHGPDGTSLIDAPDSAPIAAALDAKGWKLDSILITHHHSDHVDGVADLRQRYGCAVIGPEAESSKLPPLDIALSEGHHSGLPGLPGDTGGSRPRPYIGPYRLLCFAGPSGIYR